MVWRMRFTCWINEATDTHFEYVIRIEFAQQSQFRERASVFINKYITSLVRLSWQVLLRWQASCFLHRILQYNVSGDLLHPHSGWLSSERKYLFRVGSFYVRNDTDCDFLGSHPVWSLRSIWYFRWGVLLSSLELASWRFCSPVFQTMCLMHPKYPESLTNLLLTMQASLYTS